MNSTVQKLLRCACAALLTTIAAGAAVADEHVERYVHEPMPPSFTVEHSDEDGPVYADASGKTLYMWTGELKGKPRCDGRRRTIGRAGPDGFLMALPEVESRPSCTDVWPITVAAGDAQPVGKWSILVRDDGVRQWAHDGQPLYTSTYDRRPGEVNAGNKRVAPFRVAPPRVPVGPRADVPPDFAVATIGLGRVLTTAQGMTVYTSDRDRAGESRCDAACARTWRPMIAPALAKARSGEWSTVERAPGVKQWAFRDRPLYTYALDRRSRDLRGTDVAGWQAALIKPAAPLPAEVKIQQVARGLALADRSGRTLYQFVCTDFGPDALYCDRPDATHVYRLAICGAGSQEECARHWRPLLAPSDAKSSNKTWSVARIDPHTGRYAEPQQADALRVWMYRGRPLYTYHRDTQPGDTHGDAVAFSARRIGFETAAVRDDDAFELTGLIDYASAYGEDAKAK